MLNGRPGPAILDITMDAQMDVMEYSKLEKQNYSNFSEKLQKRHITK